MYKMHIKPFAILQVILCLFLFVSAPLESCAKAINTAQKGYINIINRNNKTYIEDSENVDKYADLYDVLGTDKEVNSKLDDFENVKNNHDIVNVGKSLNTEDETNNEETEEAGSKDNTDNNGDNSSSEEVNAPEEIDPLDPSNKDDENDLEVETPDKEEDIQKPDDNSVEPDQNTEDESIPDEAKEDELTEEEPVEDENMLSSFGTLIDENSTIVNDVNEFKNALTNDNGITTVYLAIDIIVPAGGIKINTNKTNLVIDGINPEDPEQVRHVITDRPNTESQLETILIPNLSKMTNIIIRNLDVQGSNFYGFVSVWDTVKNVYMIYENVSYKGSQITYNRYGRSRYENCDIEIYKYGYSYSKAQEVAETTHVELAGNVKINHRGTTDRAFWIPYSSGSITVESGANIDVSVEFTTFVYNDAVSVPFTIGKDAVFRFSGPQKFGEQQFGAFTIEEGAQCYIETKKAYDAGGLLRVSGPLTVKEGAILEVLAGQSAYSTIVMLNGYAMDFQNPKRVVFYNGNKPRVMRWGNSGKLNIKAQQLNIWTKAGDGGLADLPLYSWRRKRNELLEAEGQGGSDSVGLSSFSSSNLGEDETDVPLNSKNFNVATAQVVSFGILELTANLTTGSQPFISGVTDPDVDIKVSYVKDGNPVNLFTKADSEGNYRVDVDDNADAGTHISVSGNYRYLTTTVDAEKDGELSFFSVPDSLSFETSELSNFVEKVGRKDIDWQIVILDTRLQSSNWKLSARLEQPLTPVDRDVPDINDGVVFVDSNNNSYPLQVKSDTTIYKHDGSSTNKEITIGWDSDTGIMAEIQPGAAYKDVEYKSSIVWNLIDAP